MKHYMGIDIGKKELVIHYQQDCFTLSNDDSGHKKLITYLNKQSNKENTVIVCEATGGYETQLIITLRGSGALVHRAHPNKIRAFARSKGLLAKTDKIDALMIRDYGQTMQVTANGHSTCELRQQLSDLYRRREQLLADKHKETMRLEKPLSRQISKYIHAHLSWLDKQLEKINVVMLSLIQKDEKINKDITLMCSIPSVGQITAIGLVCYLPELGQLSHKKLSALVGVAPMNKDSGSYRGRRYIQGGRNQLRKILYMACLSAIRYNALLRSFYIRLKAAAKPGKVIMVALMRKLLTVLNSIMKRQVQWQASFC